MPWLLQNFFLPRLALFYGHIIINLKKIFFRFRSCDPQALDRCKPSVARCAQKRWYVLTKFILSVLAFMVTKTITFWLPKPGNVFLDNTEILKRSKNRLICTFLLNRPLRVNLRIHLHPSDNRMQQKLRDHQKQEEWDQKAKKNLYRLFWGLST